MIRKWFGITVLVLATASLLGLPSCAHNTHLVSIAIQPGNGTFAAADPGLSFQYRAYGSYIHPPKTVDITDQVTWQSSAPQVAQFTSPGVVSPNTNCGVAQIFATMHDSPNDIVSNQVSITVDGPASLGCPTGTATNTLTVNPTGGQSDGTFTSSPSGINCGSGNTVCSAPFATGSTVAVTAMPNSTHSFLGWSSCPGPNGNTCSVVMSGDIKISGAFD